MDLGAMPCAYSQVELPNTRGLGTLTPPPPPPPPPPFLTHPFQKKKS